MEALLARRFHKGKGKFKGKLPIICFNCNEVGHITTRCPQKRNYKQGNSTRIEKKMIVETTWTKAKSATFFKKRIQMKMVMK